MMPSHYGLSELIERLRVEPDQSKRVKVGFRNPHSFRGYYEQLAFEYAKDVTVAEMLTAAESALGATFHGWKGGNYTMTGYTETWLVRAEGDGDGETLGAVLLDLMLAVQVPQRAMSARGRPLWLHEVCGTVQDDIGTPCRCCEVRCEWQPLYVLGEGAS